MGRDTWPPMPRPTRSWRPNCSAACVVTCPRTFAAQADAYIRQCQEKGETIASRKASQNTLNAFGPHLPELLGGSADLAGSNLTLWNSSRGPQSAWMPAATMSSTACANSA